MQTLYEKVNQGLIDQLDALDITLSLCCLIEDCREFVHLDPYGVALDEDNNITILSEARPVDCFFAAPDVVLDGAEASRASMRFSMGLLLFYMLNRKSYYDAFDQDPFDLAEGQPGGSLVDPACYNGKAADVISALTAWNAEARTEGIGRLLQLVDHVPSDVTLQYVLNGQIVHSEQKEVREDIENFRGGETIRTEDGSCYRILPGARVRFRPGYHTVWIPVDELHQGISSEPRAADNGNAHLLMCFDNPEDPSRPVELRLMPLDSERHTKLVAVSLLNPMRYRFFGEYSTPGMAPERRELFHLDVPADRNLKRAFLAVTYHVQPRGFSAVLCDRSGKTLSNARHFKMN